MGNPNHDDKGRFAEGPGGGPGSPASGDSHPASQRGGENMSGGARHMQAPVSGLGAKKEYTPDQFNDARRYYKQTLKRPLK